MYAVFQSGGKQHRVSKGQTIRIEKLDQPAGAVVEFDQVLMLSGAEQTEIGAPFIEGGKVSAEIVAHGRDKKIHIIKFRRRKHSQKKQGHRQWFTEIRVCGISCSE